MSLWREEIIGGFSVKIEESHRTITIYCICSREDGRTVYVGSTSQALKHRVRGHCLAAKDGDQRPIYQWMRTQPGFIVRILEQFEDVGAGKRASREKHWVSSFTDLLNVTDGGLGGSGVVWSIERRKKLSDSNRTGAYFECKTCGTSFWRKRRDIALGNNKFCSRPCYSTSLRGKHRPLSKNAVERGVAAAAAAKRARTHCSNGHEFTEDNTRFNKSGARVCRQCLRDYKRRNREAVNAFS